MYSEEPSEAEQALHKTQPPQDTAPTRHSPYTNQKTRFVYRTACCLHRRRLYERNGAQWASTPHWTML